MPGSGKTYVLVTRLVALMLSGVAPEKLLCLTYTRSAAAEMQERLFALCLIGRSCRMRNGRGNRSARNDAGRAKLAAGANAVCPRAGNTGVAYSDHSRIL